MSKYLFTPLDIALFFDYANFTLSDEINSNSMSYYDYDNDSKVIKILIDGSEKARKRAQITVDQVKDAMGINYFGE